jgi:hypothetical protein
MPEQWPGSATVFLMGFALHDRLSGHASRVRVLDRILTQLRERDDVWWARKDQTADYILSHHDSAAWVHREPAPSSGLPGTST